MKTLTTVIFISLAMMFSAAAGAKDEKKSQATTQEKKSQAAPQVSSPPPPSAKATRPVYQPPKLGKPARTVGGGSRGSKDKVPTLFVQGTRDKLADLERLRCVLDTMAPVPTLHVVDGADHGFHVLRRSGRTDDEALDEIADAVRRWLDGLG